MIMNGGQTSAATGSGSSSKTGGTSAADIAAMFAQLLKEASKTPEERARDAVLEKHGLTEASYNSLPSAQRQGIDREIADAVRRVAEQRRASMAARNGVAA